MYRNTNAIQRDSTRDQPASYLPASYDQRSSRLRPGAYRTSRRRTDDSPPADRQPEPGLSSTTRTGSGRLLTTPVTRRHAHGATHTGADEHGRRLTRTPSHPGAAHTEGLLRWTGSPPHRDRHTDPTTNPHRHRGRY